MTHLVARLILTMLILPVAGAVFVLGMAVIIAIAPNSPGPPPLPTAAVWGAVYLVVAFTWIMIWRPVVRWTPRRIGQTVLWGIIALAAGGAFGFTISAIGQRAGMPMGVPVLLGGGAPPIVWILSTVLVWRESALERTERMAGIGPAAEAVVCPMCGYDMGDVRAAQCPECGVEFTIGQLIAAQPDRALQALDGE